MRFLSKITGIFLSVNPRSSAICRHFVALFSVMCASCLSVVMAQPVVAPLSVNGQEVSATKVDLLVNAAMEAGQKDSAALRAQVREALVQHEVLLQAAKKAPVAQQPAVQAQAQYNAETTLVRAYLQQWLQQNPIAVDAVQAEYDALKVRMGDQEVQIRHILVASSDEAAKVLAQIAAGGKFEDFVTSHSQDSASKQSGGLMPWVVQGALLPDIGQAISKLKKGQMASAPVKGAAGYHLVRLEDTRPFNPPSLAQVQSQIQRNLEAKAVNAHIQKLREAASVK
jgi:peptidyl-prolyl cis-trans isomerase C